MVGIASAPASTMTSEQTVARIGRRMKVSTNIAFSARLDGRAVADLLYVRDDHAVAGGQASADDVVLAHDVAERHRLLPRDESLLRRLGDEDEMLTGNPIDRDDRDRQ